MSDTRRDVHPVETATETEAETVSTRRAFVGGVARKAAYAAPAILALAPRTALAGASVCGETGSLCYADTDCCVGWTCQDMMGDPVSMGRMGQCQ